MKVNVFEINEKGVTLAFKGEEPFIKDIAVRLTADDPDAVRVAKAARIQGNMFLTRDGKTVFIEGSATADFTPPCARCLQPVETHLAPTFFLTLFPDRNDEEGEVELTEDELDENTYRGEEIDVAEVLNEQILMERPYVILCSEDCKGLCPSCGANRNESPCNCEAQPASLAFQALKDVKIDLEKE